MARLLYTEETGMNRFSAFQRGFYFFNSNGLNSVKWHGYNKVRQRNESFHCYSKVFFGIKIFVIIVINAFWKDNIERKRKRVVPLLFLRGFYV